MDWSRVVITEAQTQCRGFSANYWCSESCVKTTRLSTRRPLTVGYNKIKNNRLCVFPPSPVRWHDRCSIEIWCFKMNAKFLLKWAFFLDLKWSLTWKCFRNKESNPLSFGSSQILIKFDFSCLKSFSYNKTELGRKSLDYIGAVNLVDFEVIFGQLFG